MTERVDQPVVLAIDDNPGDLTLLELAFVERGIAVRFEQESDGEQAIRHLERTVAGTLPRPNVIILDLNMPRVSGQRSCAPSS